MVASRSTDHAFGDLLGRHLRHLVVGAAQLEAAYRLLVFPLEQHRIVQTAAQSAGGFQRCFAGHVVHAGGQNFLEVVRRGEV